MKIDKTVFQTQNWSIRIFYDDSAVTDRRSSNGVKKLVYIDEIKDGAFYINCTINADLSVNKRLTVSPYLGRKNPPTRIVDEAIKQAKLLSKK